MEVEDLAGDGEAEAAFSSSVHERSGDEAPRGHPSRGTLRLPLRLLEIVKRVSYDQAA